MLSDRTKRILQEHIKAVFGVYEALGFNVTIVQADKEFEYVKEYIRPGVFDGASTDDHVQDVERFIQTIKSDVRTICHFLPFESYPRLLSSKMVIYAIRSWNQLPHPDGISPYLSPLSIVTGLPPVDISLLKQEVWEYFHVFNEMTTTNTMAARTSGALTLNPCGNVKGDYYFRRTQWTVVPMPTSVITQVHTLAEKNNSGTTVQENNNENDTIDEEFLGEDPRCDPLSSRSGCLRGLFHTSTHSPLYANEK